jgi:predicted DNA repair protein MutK
VGTAAMLWVGGSIVLHGLEVTHLWAAPYVAVHHLAEAAGQAVPAAAGFVVWAVGATLDGLVGLAIGLALIPLATKVLLPALQRLKGARPVQ